MTQYNFIIAPTDTDSISFCKPTGAEFLPEEVKSLITELNGISPEYMVWEDDGYYDTIICIKAKNYITRKHDGTLVYKGSGVKATMKEVALREFIKEIIDEILNDTNRFEEVYTKYVKEIMSIQDIKRWTSKKTITPAVLEPKRLQEQKLFDAIQGTEYVEGDKVRVAFLEDDSLCLEENINGNYSKDKLLNKLFDTAKLFSTIIEIDEVFKNYKLKKWKKDLELLK